jgi:hypothetical protein
MIRAGSKVLLVADSSKFGQSALVRVGGLEDVGLVVTDEGLPPEATAAYPVEIMRVPVSPPRPAWERPAGVPEQGRSRRPSSVPASPQASAPPPAQTPAQVSTAS